MRMILDSVDNAMTVMVASLMGLCLIVAIVRWLFRSRPPVAFRCARCHREVLHDRRTEEAWRSGKHKIFCAECHRKWRQMHPAVRETYGRGGCMLPLVLVMSLVVFGVCVSVRMLLI